MSKSKSEGRPQAVPDKAIRGGEAPDFSWVEPTVWTDPMLEALQSGVKGGRWYSLNDKVSSKRLLTKAFDKVKANHGAAGVDHLTVDKFEGNLKGNLDKISRGVGRGVYHPRPIKRRWVPKPGGKGKRPLGIPTVGDRIVQTALKDVLEPIFEVEFAESSYGFRPGRNTKDALREVDRLLKDGYHWVVDADIESFFDNLSHQKLMDKIREKVTDGKVLDLIEAFLNQEVMEGLNQWKPETGTPQGAVISPLLSNIYLNSLDHLITEKGFNMIRYADDLVILAKSEEEAKEALRLVENWMEEAGLNLNPDKTKIVDAGERGGFNFLGYHFERGYRWPRKRSLRKLKDTIRDHTKRTNGESLDSTISKVSKTLKGWFEYYKHSHYTTFPPLDQWIRMRLRSILRKRRGGKGRGRGRDHQRWPNSFFAKRGLFSLVAAHRLAIQSSKR